MDAIITRLTLISDNFGQFRSLPAQIDTASPLTLPFSYNSVEFPVAIGTVAGFGRQTGERPALSTLASGYLPE